MGTPRDIEEAVRALVDGSSGDGEEGGSSCMDQLLIHIFIDRVVYQDDLSFCLGKINIIAVFRVQERGLDPIRRSAPQRPYPATVYVFSKGSVTVNSL